MGARSPFFSLVFVSVLMTLSDPSPADSSLSEPEPAAERKPKAALKVGASVKRDTRLELERSVAKKLESLGVKAVSLTEKKTCSAAESRFHSRCVPEAEQPEEQGAHVCHVQSAREAGDDCKEDA